jgi:hypothetical protein
MTPNVEFGTSHQESVEPTASEISERPRGVITVLLFNPHDHSLTRKDDSQTPAPLPTPILVKENLPPLPRMTIFVGRVIQSFSRIGAHRPT